ncbi:hypothetical protein TNCV_4145211 [Trichonephila clavipes]|nr:hypothetical protein TNCV_4145211 [Trichonephila clavipes]
MMDKNCNLIGTEQHGTNNNEILQQCGKGRIETVLVYKYNNKRKSDGALDESNILRMQSPNDDEDTLSDNSQLLTEIESLQKQVEH